MTENNVLLEWNFIETTFKEDSFEDVNDVTILINNTVKDYAWEF